MISNLKKSKVQDGVFLIILSGLIIKEALNYHKYGSWALSPSLIPIGISCVIILLSLAMIIPAIKSEEEEAGIFSWEAMKSPAAVIALTVLYLALLPILHFLIASCGYLVVMMMILGERKFLNIGLISVVIPLSLYGLFAILLGVRLP